jgi:magnesium transporter
MKRTRRAAKEKPIAVKQEEKGLNLQEITWGDLKWIYIEQPTETEIEYLAQNYPFHPLDLDDCLSRIQRPKIDEYKEYRFIVLHFPIFSKEARVTLPSQVSIFIGKDYLITLHAGDLNPLAKFFRDCQLNEESRNQNMKSSGFLLYRIVDRLVDYCFPILTKIMNNIEKVEDDIFDTKQRQTVEEISILRRDIISYRRVIWPLRAVISTLERKTAKYTPEDLEAYWGDIVDHVDKIWDNLDECKEIIEGLEDTNDSLYSHRTNEVIRILTIMATIMLPLTVVASIYGMNVRLPGGQDAQGGLLSFGIIMMIMVAVIIGMLYFFRRRHWI